MPTYIVGAQVLSDFSYSWNGFGGTISRRFYTGSLIPVHVSKKVVAPILEGALEIVPIRGMDFPLYFRLVKKKFTSNPAKLLEFVDEYVITREILAWAGSKGEKLGYELGGVLFPFAVGESVLRIKTPRGKSLLVTSSGLKVVVSKAILAQLQVKIG